MDRWQNLASKLELTQRPELIEDRDQAACIEEAVGQILQSPTRLVIYWLCGLMRGT